MYRLLMITFTIMQIVLICELTQFYRVTIQVVSNLPLTTKMKVAF